MHSRSDVAFRDTDDKWSLKPEYILYLNHWDGFTEKLWFYDLLIDKEFKYIIVFRSFAISYAKQQHRVSIELEGTVSENVSDAIRTFSTMPFEPIIRTPTPGMYEHEDGGSDSYLVAMGSNTLDGGFTFGLSNAERVFVNNTERSLYALHIIIRDWLNNVLSEAEKLHSMPG